MEKKNQKYLKELNILYIFTQKIFCERTEKIMRKYVSRSNYKK